MRVQKRNGVFEPVSLEKITERIAKASQGLDKNFVDEIEVAKRVVEGLYDGVTTSHLDKLAAETAASMAAIHPDYAQLASNIAISALHKETPKHFIDAMSILYTYIEPKTGVRAGLIDEQVFRIMDFYAERLENEIDHSRDFLLDYFGFKTLERSYLLKAGGRVVERPQYMWMRVAVGIHRHDIEAAIETYHMMSQKVFTHASPTLFNAGTSNHQLSSCFLLALQDDSIDGIYETLKQTALISKRAGGIGVHVHNVRAKGSYIKGTNGTSNGILPMLRVFNDTARYVDQAGKRKGAFAVYLEPWHADVFDFLDMRKNHGKEEMRCRDLFTAMWIPDLFMERVEKDLHWSLFCPNEAPGLSDCWGDEFRQLYTKYETEGRARETIKARDVWFAILESQIETGTPYMLYKDACNGKSNQQNLGTIKSSNLCVAPETKILTRQGYQTISTLKDQEVDVWNGSEYSSVTVRQTGEYQQLLKVVTDSGYDLECTPYHEFYVQPSYGTSPVKVKAEDLRPGDKLIKLTLPTNTTPLQEFSSEGYTNGFYSADGCYTRDKFYPHRLYFYGKKADLTEFVLPPNRVTVQPVQNRTYFDYDNLLPKFYVPSIQQDSTDWCLSWLAGLLDGDGCTSTNQGNCSLQLANTNYEFLKQVQLLLQELGVLSKIKPAQPQGPRLMPKNDGTDELSWFECQASYRLLISGENTQKLLRLGLPVKKLTITYHRGDRDAERFVKIKEIINTGRFDDTYCFNEPLKHLGVFNGLLTGQCTEVVEYSDKDEVAVCNLASISLPSLVTDGEFDFKKLHQVAKILTRNLNKVIDLTFYPLEQAQRSNLKHRPIGLGVQGLADAFALLKFPFESDEARSLNASIFETIYHGALEASMELAKEQGPYSSFQNSPASKGILQFDLWGVTPTAYDWDALKDQIRRHGLRNSLLVAPMPTASTAQILGNTESFEPITSNIYSRRVLAGEFTLVNKHLVRELVDLGLWNETIRQKIIAANGSVQSVMEIPEVIKRRYRTVWEISQKHVIDMAADRGAFICQSQSLNLYMSNPNFAKLGAMHFYGWKKGLKTGMYYLRSQAAMDAIKFTVDKKLVEAKNEIACSLDNPEACESCSG